MTTCSDASRRLDSIQHRHTDVHEHVARYLGQLAPIVHTLANGARALGTPPTRATTYASLVSAWSKLAADMDRDVATAKSGAAAALRRQIPTEFAQSAKADALAKRFGATSCA